VCLPAGALTPCSPCAPARVARQQRIEDDAAIAAQSCSNAPQPGCVFRPPSQCATPGTAYLVVLRGCHEDTGRLFIAHVDESGALIGEAGTLSVPTFLGLAPVPASDVPFDVGPLLQTPTNTFSRKPRRTAWVPHPAFQPLWSGPVPWSLPKLSLSQVLSALPHLLPRLWFP